MDIADTQYEFEMRLGDLIRRAVAQYPSATAISFEGKDVSYTELDNMGWSVALRLRSLGVGPGTLVGVHLDRGIELVAALVGVIYSGGAYVPLDPSYPKDRVAHMCEDARLRVVIARDVERLGSDSVFADGIQLLDIDKNLEGDLNAHRELVGSPLDTAYVIYTSGSTGRPKGVAVSHQSACNSILWLNGEVKLTTADSLLFKTSISFDPSVWEIFGVLQAGGRLVLARPGGERDPRYLVDTLLHQKVTILLMVPSALKAMLEEPNLHQLPHLRQVICGGEMLDWTLIDRLRRAAPGVTVHNLYGPTEATIYATGFRVEPQLNGTGGVPIGAPITNNKALLLNPEQRLLPAGETGELYIGGAGVALGYLHRPELNTERFIQDPFSNDPSARLYRTGDLARWLPDGTLEFLGRNDSQVKIRGYRIETGEIETILAGHPEIANCAVLAREDSPGNLRLVAYLVPRSNAVSNQAIREFLSATLPDHMVPSYYVTLSEMPLLPNEKIDRKALPPPDNERPELSVPYQAPINHLETCCSHAFGTVLALEGIGRNDNFFELGGSSLQAMRVLAEIEQLTGYTLTPASIFAHPTPSGLASGMAPRETAVQKMASEGLPVSPRHPDRNGQSIALIGMSGRFPGASTVERLWENLLRGQDGITQFTDETLDPSLPPSLVRDINYVKARGIVDGVEQFDNSFFGISAREAETMDPQHRLLLEIAWECLERAGYAPDQTERPVGVFAGISTPTYLQRHVMVHPEAIERVGEFQVAVGNDKDFAVTRVAHKLNLKGPAIAINTACSTSLVAIAQAVDSLRLGRCDMALAGGASVTSPPHSGYLYQEGAMLSRNGQTRTFDTEASGTTFNDGAAVVLLKRLSDALADGDQIFAVIRGVATNNDGGGKASFTAPSVEGQAAVIAAAHVDAGVDPRTISYLEAHGTATPLGDPVEVEGLTRAFQLRTRDTGFCRIGSVKSNVGHLISAAGATGVIKTALALATEQLPASIHFDQPNSKIDFAHSPFVVHDALTPWPRSDQPRRAGVSSFGVGGTNAHAVLEEPPLLPPSPAAKGSQLLILSAKTRSAVDSMATRLADHLEATPDLNIADVAHTLRVGRSQFSHRLCVVASGANEAVEALRVPDHPRRALRTLGAAIPPVVLLFPGQGAQYAGMGREVYADDMAFRSALDDCLSAFEAVLPFDLKDRMFNGGADSLVTTGTTQPATFAVEYALARAWIGKGLRPTALIGHSVGEFAAAAVAGIMSLEDAARLVARRGELMEALPGGSMLSVRLKLDKLLALLPPELSLAAENGPTACVVAGPTPAVEAFGRRLESEGVSARMLQTSHAFHSSMMDPALAPFEAEVRKIQLSSPRITIFSTLTGQVMTPEQATDPHYWARHLREPVRFSRALQSALEQMEPAFLEVGPRGTLSTLARQHQAPAKRLAIASLGDSPETELSQLAFAIGQLWTLGIELPLNDPSRAEGRRRILLPTYPFERKRFWLDAAPQDVPSRSQLERTVHHAALTVPAETPSMATPQPSPEIAMSSQAENACASRLSILVARLCELFEDVAGIEMANDAVATSFLDLGLDSLSLTQAALQVKKTFEISVSFRQLMEQYRSVEALAQYLDSVLPVDQFAPVIELGLAPSATPSPAPAAGSVAPSSSGWVPPGTSIPNLISGDAVHQLLQQQMQLMAQQLAVLAGQQASAIASPIPTAPAQTATSRPAQASERSAAAGERADASSQPTLKALVENPFGASPRLTLQAEQAFTPAQREWLGAFIARYNTRTGKSKSFSQQHRKLMADPRVVTGFNPLWKDLVYPIVADRSRGANLWDLDGNEYIDLLSCFGGNLLGYQPIDVIEAMHKQLQLGLEVGPQHPMAAEVAQLISDFTGMERVGFCNTGSEAVMGAMRIARTVTGRKTIAIFSNSYHGIFDEVIVRGTKQLRSLSAAPGILANTVENILVLDWNSEESLRILRERGPELAAIMTEPVQNRHPDIQPRAFVAALREIADKAGCALIFDEVVTGFRVAPGGAQELYGVRADVATYGKVIGGGLPFAAIAGSTKWLDALDGGHWQYGDHSFPEAGVTYFAGTFVRHPLALAAARATLLHIKQGGREFYRNLNDRTRRLIETLNTAFAMRGAPVKAIHCASIWRLQWDDNQKYTGLFYYLLRFHGLHVYEQFGHFVTEAMTDEHITRIVQVFADAIGELMGLGFIIPRSSTPPPTPREKAPDVGTPVVGQLAPGQSERWLAAAFDPAARRALNESHCVVLSGAVNIDAMRQALHDVMKRHETLRVHFDLDEPKQLLGANTPVQVEEFDLTGQGDVEKALSDFCEQASLRDFPLDKPPLMALSLLKLADGRTAVHSVASHLVFDGWSASILNTELAAAYKARSTGLAHSLPPAESMVQFAQNLQAQFDGPEGQASLDYWRRALANPPARLNLGDRTPPTPRAFSADTRRLRIPGEQFRRLRTHARGSGATLFQLLLTAVTVMLQKRSGQSDFVVCIPYAGQNLRRHGPLMADGVLDLPLRLGCTPDDDTKTVLHRVRAHLMDALEHPLMTQGTVARALGIRSSGDRPPLTGIYFNLNPKIDLSAYAPLEATMHEGRKRGLLSELFFSFYEEEDALSLDLHYSSEFFSPERAQELVDALLAQITHIGVPAVSAPPASGSASATQPASAPPSIDPRLLAWNSATQVPLEPGARVEQWISRQAAATANATALLAAGVTLSYAELEAQANRFARVLLDRGIGPGMLVGVCLTRGPDLVPSLLGILKTGAAYVPLDPGFPKDRLTHMASDAGVRLVITDAAHADLSGIPRDQQLRIDDDAATLAAASQAASPALSGQPDDATTYVIYTSGSTGKPKGVVLPQKAVCNFLASMRREPGLKAADRLLAVTTLSFDIAVLELFLPLTTGACVVLAQREEAMDPYVLSELIADHRINVMQATPTTWHMLLETGWRAPHGFRALCGGEPLPPSLARSLLKAGVELWNMYGPTETTVWSTVCRITDANQKITIGHPIDNTQVWVLDDQLQPCQIGREGELCIGGAGVATGYFNRPELTAEKFLHNPFDAEPGARIYRTGDLARWREDGALEHLGRLDFQVKIRGYRIELGEIEARLTAIEGVARTVVMAREDSLGDVRLVGYAVPQAGRSLDAAELRETLRVGLPDYMVPQRIMLLDRLPLLPNGKIDRKALPAPSATTQIEAYLDPVVEEIRKAMADILGVATVQPTDDFFELGGHSLLAAQLLARLSKRFGKRLGLRVLFESPSAGKLAQQYAIAQESSGALSDSEIIPRRADQSRAPLTPVQMRMWFIENMNPGTSVHNVPSGHRLRGPFDLASFRKALKLLVARQSALRTAIVRDGDGVFQRVLPEILKDSLPFEDLSAQSGSHQQKLLEERLAHLGSSPIDPEIAPLFRMHLFRLAPEEHLFFFMAHHIIWDGWSIDVMYRELSELYSACCEGRQPKLPELPISYGDFAAWQASRMAGAEGDRQTAYWKKMLTPLPPPLALPLDMPRPEVLDDQGASLSLKLSPEATQQVIEITRRHGITTFAVLFSAFAVTLHRRGQQSDFAIGTPVWGRDNPNLQDLMGVFINVLPIRVSVQGGTSFLGLMKEIRNRLAEGFSCPDVPFEQVVRALNPPRDRSRTPVYQALISFQDVRERPLDWGKLRHSRAVQKVATSAQDIGLWTVLTPAGLELSFRYNTHLFHRSTIEQVADDLKYVLEEIVRDSAQAIEDIHPSPQTSASVTASNRRPPRNEIESQLAASMALVLQLPAVNIDDDFFSLGGHSLLALRLVEQINRELGFKLSLSTLLQSPTVEQLAASMEAPAKGQNSLLKLRSGAGRPGVFFIHDVDGEVLLYRNLAMRLDARHPVYALQPHGNDELPILHTRISEMADYYLEQIISVQPAGPYILAGLCAGGEIAFEIACRLQAQGQQIATLALFDSTHANAAVRSGLLLQSRMASLKEALNANKGGNALTRLMRATVIVARKTLSYLRYQRSSRIAQAKLDAELLRLQTSLDKGERPPSGTHKLTVRQIVHHAQWATRVHNQLAGDVLLLRAKNGDGTQADRPFVEIFEDPLFGWSEVVEGNVIVADVDGGHSSMLQEPFVASSLAVLQRHIDAALNEEETQPAQTYPSESARLAVSPTDLPEPPTWSAQEEQVSAS